jgi:preprotein translocase subunit SecG
MGFLGIAILVILTISAVLLILVILVQDEEGEGIGGLFGGGSSTAFGSRSGNILTRFTAILAVIFLFCAFALAWINRSPSAGNVIGKARQETLKEGESSTWWAEMGGTQAGTSSAGSGALPESAPTGGE